MSNAPTARIIGAAARAGGAVRATSAATRATVVPSARARPGSSRRRCRPMMRLSPTMIRPDSRAQRGRRTTPVARAGSRPGAARLPCQRGRRRRCEHDDDAHCRALGDLPVGYVDRRAGRSGSSPRSGRRCPGADRHSPGVSAPRARAQRRCQRNRRPARGLPAPGRRRRSSGHVAARAHAPAILATRPGRPVRRAGRRR